MIPLKDPADASVIPGNSRGGNPANVREKKLMASKSFGGDAPNGYETDIGKIIEQTMMDRVSKAKHAEMNRILIEEGLAIEGNAGDRHEGFTKIENVQHRGQTGEPGDSALFVKDSIYSEYRKAVDIDEHYAGLRKVLNVPTQLSLIGAIGEATTHLSNNFKAIYEYGPQGMVDLVKNITAVAQKNPDILKKVMELAQQGMIKNKGMESGSMPFLGKFDFTKYTGQVLDFVDTVQRLTVADHFDRLAKRQEGWGKVEDTISHQRDFVNSIMGNYNKRASNWVVALLKDTGVGPFATAGSTNLAQGFRSLYGGSNIKAETYRDAAVLRAEKLLRMATVLSVVPLANYLLWGNAFGDDNTPLMAIKTGTRDGKTTYFDVGSLTGLKRGMRLTGLLALAEGNRPAAGATNAHIANRAFKDFIGSVLGPAEGPAVGVAHTIIGSAIGGGPGEDIIGRRIAKKKDAGWNEYQFLANIQALIWNANPVIAALTGAASPELHESNQGFLGSIGYPNSDTTATERLLGALGPFGTKARATPPGTPHR